ncbi:hypothetical protein FXB40_34140 [Bradyrhizobium rifense]|uniref:Uncharacterized protein n=1 Tax=Bradyrhizobium rifense TaxID=515499 RepID=A0A5D3K7S0_9BRAD|nr:hypothetical protein [Bradyrhizobium rifense]TYL89971.1 hypothetical protein FXB40_34140 [Bradyrhizobium rifense]
MQTQTINELMRLTRIELCTLAARITNALANLPEGSPERETALINLRNIRVVLARRDWSP